MIALRYLWQILPMGKKICIYDEDGDYPTVKVRELKDQDWFQGIENRSVESLDISGSDRSIFIVQLES